MTSKKNLGIWMDHASAHLTELTVQPMETKIIQSAFSHEEKVESLGNSEHLMHNKEQHLQSAFYKQLGEAIKGYDEVLLFGPTDAKAELHNLLKADHHFDNIKIDVKQTDKMNENQQHIFLTDHFKQK